MKRDSVLHLLGGKAKRAYRRITLAVAMLDEWSAFDQQIEKSGDPGGLAKGRLVSIHTRHYWRVKLFAPAVGDVVSDVSIHTRHYWRVKRRR